MSAKSRSRKYLELPLAPSDRIVRMHAGPDCDFLTIYTLSGRVFEVEQVKGWKRPFKVREMKNGL